MCRAQDKEASHSSELCCDISSPGKENAQHNSKNEGASIGATANSPKAATAPLEVLDRPSSSILQQLLSSPYVKCAIMISDNVS
jgi:hypothetical protein